MYSVYQSYFNKAQILRLSEKALEVCSQGWGMERTANIRGETGKQNVLILPKVPGKKGHNDKGLGIGRLSTMEGKLCWWVPCLWQFISLEYLLLKKKQL